MNLVPVLPGEAFEPGGVYIIELTASDAVLDRLVRMPDLGKAIARIIVEVSGVDAEYGGSGVTWSRASGELRRVYSVRLNVPGVPMAPVVSAAVPVGRIVWAVAGLLAAAGVLIVAVKIYKLEEETVPEVIEGVRDTARAASSAIAWLVFGGLAVGGYLIADRQGWLK